MEKDIKAELGKERTYRREAEVKVADMVLTLEKRRMRLEEYEEEILHLKAVNKHWREKAVKVSEGKEQCQK